MKKPSLLSFGGWIRGAPRVGRGSSRRAGFTLTELVVASSVGALVSVAVLSAYSWSLTQASLCTRIAWSQNEAMRTSKHIEEYLRNATGIVAYDKVAGRWVQVRMSDGSIGTLSYSNAVTALRDGRLYLQTTNSSQVLVARGLTEVMDPHGFTAPIFTINTRSNFVRVAYRVAEPTPSGLRAANDEEYAAIARFAACLRNAGD